MMRFRTPGALSAPVGLREKEGTKRISKERKRKKKKKQEEEDDAMNRKEFFLRKQVSNFHI